MPTRPYSLRSAAALITVLVVLDGVLRFLTPAAAALYVPPTIASIGVFAVFWVILQHRLGENVFGELGFLYVGLIVAYTVVPALAFITASFFQGGPLDQLLPEPAALRTHLWRQVLFEVGVSAGYLLLRGRGVWRMPEIVDPEHRDRRTLAFVACAIVISVAALTLLSAPVESYYDNYVRYDHLPWLAHKFVSLCIRMSLGLYCVALVFLFRNYQKYKRIIPIVVLAICAHEIVYSFGSRIETLIVLLQSMILYHYTVRKISLKWGLLACGLLVVLFSAIEVVRMLDDFSSARSAVADAGIKPPSEFLAVFFPGFHLYTERAAGTLPPREWPMFFNDFISLFTFGDFTRWNPMDWYARNYFPQAEVPPFTLGPIADSAMWGGEVDLALRSLINGMFFASIVRWFLRYGDEWWGLSVYVYCCATCILTLKYSVFLDLSLIEKNLLPVLFLVYAVRVVRFSGQRENNGPFVVGNAEARPRN